MKKKLIEVSLPLEAINVASAREKSIRHGHPSTLHLWWARRPLAACRAVLFASLVDDPASLPEQFPTEEDQQRERRRLHDIIEELVLWENSNNERVLNAARAEIMRSTNNNPPPVYDPFAGGGSIPLEAQRLGLEAHASDLNPVAVLINKALIEIPPKFAGQPPVNPDARAKLDHTKSWHGAQGLAADVRYYGHWMRAEAHQRIGHLYPQVAAVQEQDGSFRHATQAEIHHPNSALRHLTVIAWLWARTVKCPNPTCGARMPLVRSFALSTKKGKETWVEPIIETLGADAAVPPDVRQGYALPSDGPQPFAAAPPEAEPPAILGESSSGEAEPSPHIRRHSRETPQPDSKSIRFAIRQPNSANCHQVPAGTVDRRGARCLVCGVSVPLEHVRAEGKAGRMSAQMMALVAEGARGRIYLPPDAEHEAIAASAAPGNVPETDLPEKALGFRVQAYGMTKHRDLFTKRQLVALTTFSDLVGVAREKVLADARKAAIGNAESYADAVATYLACVVDRGADKWATLALWNNIGEKVEHVFGRQTLTMTWDFADGNPFSNSTGNWGSAVDLVSKVVNQIPACIDGTANQNDASSKMLHTQVLFSTDPPYYDAIGYADLSDFFYIWAKRSLKGSYNGLLGTLLVPKNQEVVAEPFRHGGRQNAQRFFEEQLGNSFSLMRQAQHAEFPLTVYYAFKQTESKGDAQTVTASTGWETMLEGLIKSGFQITGTIPMRTERAGRLRDTGSNALASSIVLVCRPRAEDAARATRGEFLRALKRELPEALRYLQVSNIAPVDLAQAAIGPGMAVYSRYAQVVESDGLPMRVRAALGIINQILDETLAEQDSEYDSDTRWALEWFAQYGMNSGPFGDADVLARAKNTSVAGLVEAGALHSRAGKVRLLRRDELPADWHPDTAPRLTIWEITQHLIRLVETQGEQAAARIFQSENIGYRGDIARDLAYRLYHFCERKGWASEALAYNGLVVAWHDIQQQADELARTQAAEQSSFEFD